MTESGRPDQNMPASTRPVPGPPRPGPHLMPRATGSAGSDDAQRIPGADIDPATVGDAVSELLGQVDEVRRSAGDEFDLGSLARQTELLERAHEVLTSALEDVDPR